MGLIVTLKLSPDKLNQEEKELLHQWLYADSKDMMSRPVLSDIGLTEGEKRFSDNVNQHLALLGSLRPTYRDPGLPPLRHQLPGLVNTQTVYDVMSVVNLGLLQLPYA